MRQIRFDDIDALKREIRDEYGPWSKEVEITQKMINAFADLTGDHQWIHVDVERCKKESPFGGPIAHGFLTLSLLPTMAGQSDFLVTGFGNATNYGADSLRFLSPVPAGSRVHAHSRIVGVEARPKGTLVTTEIAVHVVGSDRPALIYRMLVLYHPAVG